MPATTSTRVRPSAATAQPASSMGVWPADQRIDVAGPGESALDLLGRGIRRWRDAARGDG